MRIDPISNGIVIDHIAAGQGMKLYNLLGLDKADCSVALLKNMPSTKLGKKDVIKIDGDFKVDPDVIGFVAPGATINVICDGKVEKQVPNQPCKLVNVVKCQNPRCITTTEQELAHIFLLSDNGTYRCMYCEAPAK